MFTGAKPKNHHPTCQRKGRIGRTDKADTAGFPLSPRPKRGKYASVRALIAGCGYVGAKLGSCLVEKGHEVTGLRRTTSAGGELEEHGISFRSVDVTDPAQLIRLPSDWEWVIYCAAPATHTVEAYQSVYVTGLRRVVEWLGQRAPRAFVFTSSTSVYSQDDGSWVTEESPAKPESHTSLALVDGEKLLREAASSGFPSRILRVAGIYGPGRHRLKRLTEGAWQITSSGNRWMNMVHRDDLVSAISAVLENGVNDRIYNVSDGTPAQEHEVYAWLREQLGQDRLPPVVRAPISGESNNLNKRISAERLRRECGWQPQYKSYREGYVSLIAEWRRSFPT